MSLGRRLHTLGGVAVTASAVWALLVGGILAVFSLDILLTDPCAGSGGYRYTICDPPQPTSLLGWTVIVLLLAAAIAGLWKAWLWPLLTAWALLLCLLLADTVWFLIPSVRQGAGLQAGPDIGGVLATEASRPIFLACLFGFLLAVTAALAAMRRRGG